MSTFSNTKTAFLAQPGVMESYIAARFGNLKPAQLTRHLAIMVDLARDGGKISAEQKNWLLGEAQRVGFDLKLASRTIDAVQTIEDPEKRLRAYVTANGSPSRDLVDYALNLAKSYGLQAGSERLEQQMAQRDYWKAHQNSQFHFQDDEAGRFKKAREEAGTVRKTIEATLRDKGLIPQNPRTLGDAQEQAKSFANYAANKLESLGDKASLRDTLDGNYTADQAFQKLQDTGVRSQSMGDVMQQVSNSNFTVRSIDE